MILIQDAIEQDLNFVKAEMGFPNLLLKYSTPNEFIHDLTILDDPTRYPFFFINADTVTYEEQPNGEVFVTVGEMVIATKTDKDYSSEQRTLEVFKPTLIPFMEAYFGYARMSRGARISKEGKVKLHYFYGKSGLYGTDGNIFEDSVDAIQLTNYEFIIIK